MNRNTLNQVALLILLVAGQHVSGAEAGNTSVARLTATGTGVSCAAQDFPGFIGRFSNVEHAQRAFTRLPLIVQYLDTEAEPEPIPVVSVVGQNDVQFPVMPLDQERSRDRTRLEIVNETSFAAQAVLSRPNSGYKISFFFAKDACWSLVRIENWSL